MEEKYWQQFMTTGSVEDYLRFCKARNQEEERPSQGETDGREYYGNRDNPIGAASGRMR